MIKGGNITKTKELNCLIVYRKPEPVSLSKRMVNGYKCMHVRWMAYG